MANLDKRNTWSSGGTEIQKFPIQRLEPSIQKFLKVIEIDLDRLHKHRLNIEKYSRLKDWTNINKEQINTTRTVQQIVTNIKEMEKTRRQTQNSDLEKFDEKVKDMKSTALRAIQEFSEVQTEDNETTEEISNNAGFSHPLMPDKHKDDAASMIESGIERLQIHPIPQDTEAMESWENLHQNLEELNTMIHHFSTQIHTQQEKIDDIEDNIESAHENINEGTRSLGQASKLKAAIFPIAGALIGTVVAGPVGLVAGVKIGGMAAVGGGIAGYAGGRVIKKRQGEITNVEMNNLSEKKTDCDQDRKPESEGNSWLPWNW